MYSITAKGIRKSFAGKTVLSGANLTLVEGKRLALIGENGSGKSTLLKIICGELQPDGGELFGQEFGCAYIAQDFSGDDTETPEEFLLRRGHRLHKATKYLDESGFSIGKDGERLRNVRCGDLSGGEKKKLEIAAGLASGSMFIALDEPENHLDYQTIEWLVSALSKFRGGIAFVSHDQYLIDQLADTILELEDGTITAYSMGYEDYLAEKERQVAGQAQQWSFEEKTIKRLRKTVEMMKLRAQRTPDTAATYRQTKRRLGELEARHGRKPTAEQEKPKVSLSDVDQKKGKLIVSVKNASFSYGHNRIFVDANAELWFGEKAVLFGPNGSGKSTLIKLITRELSPDEGSAGIGVNVHSQFMTQDHLAGIDPAQTALDVFERTLKWRESKARACLARYGINVDLATRQLAVLSGGQQARFKLALTFAQEPEFLMLDEPTNHVDPPTWEAIVEAVKGYSGTVLAVTHDRAFIDAIAEKLWIIQDRKIRVEPGNLSEYLERIR